MHIIFRSWTYKFSRSPYLLFAKSSWIIDKFEAIKKKKKRADPIIPIRERKLPKSGITQFLKDFYQNQTLTLTRSVHEGGSRESGFVGCPENHGRLRHKNPLSPGHSSCSNYNKKKTWKKGRIGRRPERYLLNLSMKNN